MFTRHWIPVSLCIAVLAVAGLSPAADAKPASVKPEFTGIARIDVVSETDGLFLTPGAATEGATYGNAHWLKGDAQKGHLSFEAEPPVDAWAKVELTFTASANGKVRVQLMGEYHKRADAFVYFDNVTVSGAKLANGDFEAGGKTVDGWEFVDAYGATWVSDANEAQSGTRFLKVAHDLLAGQTIEVAKGAPVTITAYARRVAGSKPLSEFEKNNVDYWERSIRGFEIDERTKPVKPGTMVFVGSSSMRMWRTAEKDMLPLKVVNRGFGGSKMSDVLNYMDRLVLKHKPKAVVVYEGDNDAAGGVPADKYLANCKTFVQRLWKAQPGTPVYFIATKPSISRWRIWPLMNEYNTAVKAWCDETDGLTFIDVATPMLGADGKPKPSIFLDDKLHMNAEGYKIWIETIRPILIKDLGKDADADDR